jgi:glycosidase
MTSVHDRRPVGAGATLWSAAIALALVLGSAFAQPATDGVYYEIFVRSFQDSDGDGIGDLRGVIERLDYLDDLGVDGLWLMPIHPSGSYHGYDVTDYYAVHPDYGTLDDLRDLLDAAHARDIAVVLDLVVNHTGSGHPWFLAADAGDPAYRDYYSWSDEPLDWRGTGGGPAWHRGADGHYLGLFWSEMPDLNHRNPEVTAAMRDVAAFWLALGVDGFRIDAIQHVIEGEDGRIANAPENFAWVAEFERFVRGFDPEAFLVGETWTGVQTIARYHDEATLDMSFNYPLWGALLAGIQARSASDVAVTLRQDERLYPPGAVRATFLANHDQLRPATTLGVLRRDEPRLMLAAGLLLTMPGTPFLYYGEEIGLPNGPGDRDEEKRTPMRWRPGPGAGFTEAEPWYAFSTVDDAISVATQDADPESLLNRYRDLIALRRSSPALRSGATEVLDSGDSGVLAFRRRAGDEALLVLANVTTRERAIDLAAFGFEAATDLLTGAELERETILGRLEVLVLAPR